MNSTLLIVDDSPDLHKLIRVHLDGEAVDIHSAFNGEEGIAQAATLEPNLILLDLEMPGIDGFEVCRKLKTDSRTKAAPIIFLTANSSQGNQITGLDLGAVDFITKGFKPQELRARVRAALRGKSDIAKLAMVDGLTGLWNRTYMDLHLASHLSHARRTNRPVACSVVDIDSLKHINRNHGRKVGDGVLRTVAHLLSSHGRAEDSTGYLDNGRFLMLLPGIGATGAMRLASRARAEIQEQLSEFDGLPISATCSFGISDTETGTEASLVDRATEALIHAKNAGRNRINVDGQEKKPRKSDPRRSAA